MVSQFFGVWMANTLGAKLTLAFAVGMPGTTRWIDAVNRNAVLMYF
jgi:hypothetical protein